MPVSLRTTGTWAELTADGAVAIPATPQAGDRMYLFARWKDFSITATVANWTELEEFADGSTASGNGTGSVKVGCWYRDWQLGDTDPTIDFSASPTNASVVIIVMQKGVDEVWDTPVARTAAMTNWTTTSQSVSASATVEVRSSGVVIGLIGIRDDTATMTRPTNGIDDAGGLVTWNGNYVESPATHHSTTTGDDGAADLGYRLVTTGATGATLRLTGTISAAETGAALWVVQGVNTQLTPASTSLTSSRFVPQLQLSLTPVTASLSTTRFATQLQLALTPPATTLSTTRFAPTLRLQVTPATSTITIATFNSQLRGVTTPASATLSVTGFTPTLREQLTPAATSLSLSGFAPVVTQLLLLTVPATSLSLTTSRIHVLPFRVAFIDPGGDAVQDTGYFHSIVNDGSGISFDPTQKVVGVGSYKFDSGASLIPTVAVNGILGSARRISFDWRYDSVPDIQVTASAFCEDNAIFSDGGFTNPSGTLGDDEVYATATPARNSGQGSKMTVLGGSGLDIPAGSFILSVKIIYERKYDIDTSIGISRVKWLVNSEAGPDHDNTDMPLTDTVVEVDVTGDRFWEWQDLQQGVLEIVCEARRGDTDIEHTQSWDYVKVEVVYHQLARILSLMSASDQTLAYLAAAPKGDGVQVRFVDGAGNSYGGITELAINQFNRISVAYVLNGANDLDIQIFVNGIPELSIDGAHTNDLSFVANLQYGWVQSPGVDHVCWFDQLYIDDGDDLQDPGNALMTAKRPATVNEDEWNATVGTGAVDERPLSETNGKQHTASTGVRQTYTLQAADVGDVDISGESLLGYMGWAWAKKGAGEDGDLPALIVNNVVYPRILTTTPALLKSAISSTVFPSHAAGIGMRSNEESADTFMYESGVVVAYEGPLNPDILLGRQLINNETLPTIVDDLRADPPDSYEVCYAIDEFEGLVTIDIYSLDQDGGSLQFQGSMQASGGSGRTRINPGVEVQLNVTVTGATMLQIYRRMNID